MPGSSLSLFPCRGPENGVWMCRSSCFKTVQQRTFEQFADIPLLMNVVSQESQPLRIAKYRAPTEFEFAVSSGVHVFSHVRVQQPLVEQMKEVDIPVSQMTEHWVVVPEVVFHDRIQRRLPSK